MNQILPKQKTKKSFINPNRNDFASKSSRYDRRAVAIEFFRSFATFTLNMKNSETQRKTW